MEIKARCKYNYETCKAIAHVYSYKKRNPLKAFIFTMVFCLLFGIADIYVIQSSNVGIENYLILILIAFVLILEPVNFFLIPHIQYKSLSKMMDLGNDYIFRDEDFTAQTASEEFSGDSVVKYSFLYKAFETKDYFFLFQNKRSLRSIHWSSLQ